LQIDELEEIAELNESSERESEMIVPRKVHLYNATHGPPQDLQLLPSAPIDQEPRADLELNGPGDLDDLCYPSVSQENEVKC